MTPTKYRWKSETSKLLRILRSSLVMKRKSGWSGEGSGFVAEDVQGVEYGGRGAGGNIIIIHLRWGYHYKPSPAELNLRETEELIKFLEGKSG